MKKEGSRVKKCSEGEKERWRVEKKKGRGEKKGSRVKKGCPRKATRKIEKVD